MIFGRSMLWTRLAAWLCLALSAIAVASSITETAFADEDAARDRKHRQLLEKRDAIYASLQVDLKSVEAWCEEHSLQSVIPEVQKLSSSLKSPADRPELPRFVTPEVDKSLSPAEQQWQLQIRHHRQTRGAELYSLARLALRQKFPSLAFSLIGDVIHVDPDHKYARSILGQQLLNDPAKSEAPGYAGEWVSAFEKQMRIEGRTYRPEFGWIPLAHEARYEQNERPWKGNWISVEKEAELRRDFANAWEIPSEHFLVRTNVSLKVGVELSEKLEIYYRWLQQNFAAFFETPLALQERFDKATQRSYSRKDKPMELHFYAKREEYQKRVEGKVPNNVETTGFYSPDTRTSYFFMEREERILPTLFHEATHQILDIHTLKERGVASRVRALKMKQRPRPWEICEGSNFWIIEGLACYFESFEVVDGNVQIGDPRHVRFERARQRLVDPGDHFYMPSRQFFALGKNDFMSHPQVAPLYTQASGYAHFLMHYEDGLYRDDLIELLAAIYRPSGDDVFREPSLTRIAGVSHDEFDHQYRTHMQNLTDLIESQSASEKRD